MNKKEAIEALSIGKMFQETNSLFTEALEMAMKALNRVQEYEKLEQTGKLIRIPNCRFCKHAYKDDSRCYECIANMTCWPNNFEPRKKVKK